MAALPQGALNGLFTINANGDQVFFSQGNLQYRASTDTWQFAANQWDIIGAANSNISETYEGWIDLFGWGTSFNPTEISTDNSSYAAFTDWGVNQITNGGNAANKWRTLTKDEWEYLFGSRANYENLRGLAKINGVCGYILLPDDWTAAPEGLIFTPNPSNYTTNVYTAAEWSEKMGPAGAVFFPNTGFRKEGTSVNYVSDNAHYWLSTPDPDDAAKAWYFTSSSWFSNANKNERNQGRAVRLVRGTQPEIGDIIRYEYKGNNLYYKIYTKNETCKEVMIVNDGTPETYWTEANKPTGALVIPDSVEDWQGTKYAVAYMYSNAFRNCTGITSVDFSENKGLTYITSHGFEDCTALAEVTLSDYITTLNSYCFKGCTSLTAIDFKNVVTLSGPTNFWDCNIASVHITKSLKTIPDQTDLFDHATTITCDEENPYFVAVDNVLYSKDTTQIYGLPIGLTTAEIHVPTTVTKVLYASMMGFEGTLFINSEIKPTWPSTGGDWRNSPKGDVIVGCEFYDYYDAWRGSENNFQNITSLTARLLWDVQATADANGSVALTDTANCNEVHITATPDAGYSFWKWSNGATTAEITLEVESDTAVIAFFHPLIGNVALTVTFPDKGAEILSNYHIYTPADMGWSDLCPDGANYHCVRILFYNGSGNYYDETALKPNTTYRALFWIAPNEGYDFPHTASGHVDINNITTTVNGQNRNDFASSKDYCIFGINFTTSTATGVENVQKADGCTQKLLRNGQLLILRNGEIFNAQGARVE